MGGILGACNAISDYLHTLNMGSTLFRLILAMFLGCLIGIDRGMKKRVAGVKTHMIVCMGATLVMMTGDFIHVYSNGAGIGDTARLGAQVVSGIGFLGVGTIIITGKNQVRGLTTAAGLWTTATLGIMLGSGMLQISLILFVLIFSTMFGIARISRVQEKYNRYIGLYMEIDKTMTRGVYDYINDCGYELSSIEKKRDKTLKGSDIVLILMMDLKKRRNHAEILSEVSQLEGVYYLEEV